LQGFILPTSPPEKLIELVNELFNISKAESIPVDQVSGDIREKLQEKQKIDEEIKEADATLQTKNVKTETIDEYIRVSEKLNEYNLSFQDIDKLLNLLINAKDNGFDGKRIVAKLRKIKRLDKKEEKLKQHCEKLSEQVKECNNVLDIKELLVFNTEVNQIAKQYNLPPSVAAIRILNEIRDYDSIGGLKREISRLCQQLFVVNEVCIN
jgi:hypothetical protein